MEEDIEMHLFTIEEVILMIEGLRALEKQGGDVCGLINKLLNRLRDIKL